jgi:hypothetical protein
MASDIDRILLVRAELVEPEGVLTRPWTNIMDWLLPGYGTPGSLSDMIDNEHIVPFRASSFASGDKLFEYTTLDA